MRKSETAGQAPAVFLFACITFFFAAAAVYAAHSKGPWLDEFWSFYLTDQSLPLPTLVRDRWLYDTHPILANLLYYIVRLVGIERFDVARLLLNLPALAGLVATTILFFRTAEMRRAFYPVFAALFLGLAGSVGAATEFRSYFWQVVTLAIAVQYVHFSLSGREQEARADRVLTAIGILAVVVSLWLHFVTSLLITPFYLLAALALYLDGHRSAAKRIAIATIAAWVILAPFAVVQYRTGAQELDVRWITTTTVQALALFGGALRAALIGAAVPVAFLVFVDLRRRFRREEGSGSPRQARSDDFTAAIVRAVLIGAIGLLVLNALQPMLVSRYLFVWQVMAVAAIASWCGEAIGRTAILAALTGLWSIGIIALQTHEEASAKRWSGGLERASEILAQCPGKPLLATSYWRFTPQRHSRTAERESRVERYGYRLLAADAGVSLRLLDHRPPVVIVPDATCPTLIWVQHFTVREGFPALNVLKLGDISLSRPTSVRVVPSTEDSTLIVIGPSRFRRTGNGDDEERSPG